MINFNPLTSDLNENVYVEFIDTMGYDRGKTVNDYSGFFNQILKNDIYITSANAKLGKVGELIQYEHFVEKKSKKKVNNVESTKQITKRRLFSYTNVMAYAFVFDYNDEKSLEEMNILCKSIIENENAQNNDNQENKTIKIFICNKYHHILEDQMEEYNEESHKYIYPIYERDEKAAAFLEKLKTHYLPPLTKRQVTHTSTDKIEAELKAKQNIFFVNTKYNIGVDNAFGKICEKIIQVESLWQVIDYNSDSEESKNMKEDEDEEGRGIISSILCCGGRSKKHKTKENSVDQKFMEDDEKLDDLFRHRADSDEEDQNNQKINNQNHIDDDTTEKKEIVSHPDKNCKIF